MSLALFSYVKKKKKKKNTVKFSKIPIKSQALTAIRRDPSLRSLLSLIS